MDPQKPDVKGPIGHHKIVLILTPAYNASFIKGIIINSLLLLLVLLLNLVLLLVLGTTTYFLPFRLSWLSEFNH